MYKSIILAIAVLFFVIGLVTVLSWLLIKAAAPDKNSKFYVVSSFGEKDRECAVKISCILSVLTVLGLMSRCEIVAIDMGMTDEERERIEAAFCKERHFIICDPDSFFDKIAEKSH
ncbi:MAG: hypothetical protein IKL10_07370 [Clostridia bacterium]|nr:hypothetical protein [Clostridia bacterium]